MIDIREIKIASNGMERELCLASGIPPDVLDRRKHQPCSCGGKDRLRITKDYSFFCGGGGSLESGDYIDLMCHYNNDTITNVIAWLKDYLGLDGSDDKKIKEISKKAKRQLNNSQIVSLVKKTNTYNDFNITEAMTDLQIYIDERKNKIPSYSEINCAIDLQEQLKSVYDLDKIDKRKEYIKKNWIK